MDAPSPNATVAQPDSRDPEDMKTIRNANTENDHHDHDDEEILDDIDGKDSSVLQNPGFRDSQYYFHDGNCVLRTGNTLFRLHQSMLARDDSMFITMFKLPQGHDNTEGTSDENPIVAAGDDASQFRNFAWALYALPFEFPKVCEIDADLEKLLDIGKLSAKYSFKQLEIWASDAMAKLVDKRHANLTKAVRLLYYPQMLKFAYRSSQVKLQTALIDHYKSALELDPSSEIMVIMDLVDELDIPELFGLAYFRMLGFTWEKFHFGLHRKAQLYKGHYELTRVWDWILCNPLAFEHDNECKTSGSSVTCSKVWLELWDSWARSANVLTIPSYNIIRRLKTLVRLKSPPEVFTENYLRTLGTLCGVAKQRTLWRLLAILRLRPRAMACIHAMLAQ